MSKYKIKFCNDRKRKISGFHYSIDFLSKNHVGVLTGIFKRPHWYIDRNQIIFGYLYINISGILNLLKGKI